MGKILILTSSSSELGGQPLFGCATPAITDDGEGTVNITCSTSGATIRYTLDGSTPSESSTIYTGEFTLAATATVKARAFKDGLRASITATGTVSVPEGTWEDLPTPAETVDLVNWNLTEYIWMQRHIGTDTRYYSHVNGLRYVTTGCTVGQKVWVYLCTCTCNLGDTRANIPTTLVAEGQISQADIERGYIQISFTTQTCAENVYIGMRTNGMFNWTTSGGHGYKIPLAGGQAELQASAHYAYALRHN